MDSNGRKAHQEVKLKTSFIRTRRLMLLILLGVITVAPLGSAVSSVSRQQLTIEVIAANRLETWKDKEQVTEPIAGFSLQTSEKVGISSLFKDYYQLQRGNTHLGEPITVAFPTEQGWVQFFEAGALLLPGMQLKNLYAFQLQDTQGNKTSLAMEHGVKDEVTGIIRLPLIHALLAVGSLLPVAGEGSTLTYADLREATGLDQMVLAPGMSQDLPRAFDWEDGIFIVGGTHAGKDVGHVIPLPVWSYINRSDVSPEGWEKQFGEPLTEAVSLTFVNNGRTRHVLVQIFYRDGLILDLDTLDEAGQPGLWRLRTGVDYLRTLGFPAVEVSAEQRVWAQGETVLFGSEKLGEPLAHVGPNFPFMLLGETNWQGGELLYHVQWATPKEKRTGWVPAAQVSFDKPGEGAGWASVDALSQDLIAYLMPFDTNVGVAIYDVTRQRYYTHNSQVPYIAASSIKVPIMLAFLQMMEQQEWELDSQQTSLLITMIERSDNDSASVLYFQEIGGAGGLVSFTRGIGVEGITPDASAWGYSLMTPQSMVDLLKLLYEGRILGERYRALALDVMEGVIPEQQAGVGDTAPPGARVAMKTGWVPAQSTLWAMSSSGIVMTEEETYVIAVYTQDQYSLEDGQAIARQVCFMVSSLLL